MKDLLNYYYKIIVDDSNISDGYFSYNNHLFYLCEYKRSINEIEALSYLNKLMIINKIPINEIVSNIFNKVITIYDNRSYILIIVNYEYKDNYYNKFLLSFPNSELNILKRNNWGYLWSLKVDYIEYQLQHLENSYPIINDSINYYIGLAENAISYFNMLDLSNVNLYISHRRFKNSNIYNPLELVIDYKARDISEYIKEAFFQRKQTFNEIKDYLNKLDLEKIDYVLLYVRLLYPSYYFDIYEEIVNDQKPEDEIKKVIDMSSQYEEFLFEIYNFIKRRVNIIGVHWINRKFM